MTSTLPTLATTDLGRGDPALLHIPGWCGGREVFDPLLAQLARRYRALSVDLPGHGASPAPAADFGTPQVVDAIVEVVDAIAEATIVPVALSHAGWAALELARRLGPHRVPAVVLMDWMPLGAPPQFGESVRALQHSATWATARDGLFAMWGDGVDHPAVHAYIASMGAYGFDAWSRAGREIAHAFDAAPVPLAGFAALPQPVRVLHVYAQPRDEGFLVAQEAYARHHPWFHVHRLTATSHFPSLEVPTQVAAAIERFLDDRHDGSA